MNYEKTEGQPEQSDETVIITISLPLSYKQYLDKLAKDSERSRSYILRKLIEKQMEVTAK